MLKELITRTRPPINGAVYAETGYSFPSGHTVNAVVLYGFLAYLMYHLVPRSWRVFVVVLNIALIVIVAFSRVYLGVHYVSDVVSGLVVGAIFLIPSILISERDFCPLRRGKRGWFDR
jgi:undecaprenyl-diphosphatase